MNINSFISNTEEKDELQFVVNVIGTLIDENFNWTIKTFIAIKNSTIELDLHTILSFFLFKKSNRNNFKHILLT